MPPWGLTSHTTCRRNSPTVAQPTYTTSSSSSSSCKNRYNCRQLPKCLPLSQKVSHNLKPPSRNSYDMIGRLYHETLQGSSSVAMCRATRSSRQLWNHSQLFLPIQPVCSREVLLWYSSYYHIRQDCLFHELWTKCLIIPSWFQVLSWLSLSL
jgi:hypothetical protein